MASASTTPTGILDLPREVVDRIFANLSQKDHKTLRVVSPKFEEILNSLVFCRVRLSKARVDRLVFWNISSTPKLAAHVKELVWYELAEDENVFLETADDEMPRLPYRGSHGQELRDGIQSDNDFTLPALSALASTLFWLPSAPKHDDPQRDNIDANRSMILHDWTRVFYPALDALPKLDTFTSQPMPAYHVLSQPTSEYKFVAHLFQMDARSGIQYYQRNDGLFSVLLPAMVRYGPKIKHFHWSDEVHGNASSIKRLRHRHGLSFKYLNAIDLCLSVPSDPFIPGLRPGQRSYTSCWSILGACLDSVRLLQEISLCFEKMLPRVGLDAIIDALDECLMHKDVQLPQLTTLNLRDAASGRSPLLDVLLRKFLIRYAPTLRHLSFRRWHVSSTFLCRLSTSEKMNLESLKIDNTDFVGGADINESDLLAFLNNRRPTWPLPLGADCVRSTVGTNTMFMETPDVCDWANPKFADVSEEKDFCATVLDGTTPFDNEDDEDFEPSESTDTSDSEFEVDSDADPDDEFRPRSESGGNFATPENAGTG